MANNVDVIVSFLQSKGLSSNAIAGILGNLEVESGFNSGAANPNEGAIGIAQWEGSRRTALQQFAAQRGTSETDLNTQLDFLWSELQGYPGLIQSLNGAGSAQQAADLWDQQYERSAGTTRQQREQDAAQFAGSGLKGTGNYPSTGGTLTAAGAPTLSQADYEQALGSLSGLLTGVPELNKILHQAVQGGWAVSKFQQAIEGTNWYRTHNQAARELVSLQYSDPSEYKTRLSTAANQVVNSARQLGVGLTAQQTAGLAQQMLIQGWDSSTLTYNIGKFFSPKNEKQSLAGGIAQAYAQMKQVYQDYGIPVTDATLRNNALRIAEGANTLDAYKQVVIGQAKSMYPSLSAALDAGQTVKDAADPYMQQMSNLLEIDPNSITLNDPLIKKALQGTVTTDNSGKQSATTTSLYQFEQQLRSDPRWQYTQNAKDTISSALVHVGRDFGFGF